MNQLGKRERIFKVLGIEYFYDLYYKRNVKYPVSSLSNETTAKKRALTKKEYKIVLKTYLQHFFKKLYFENKPRYFFFSGLIEKSTHSRVEVFKNVKQVINPIIFTWYKRPSYCFALNVELNKASSTNITGGILSLERLYKKIGDIDMIKHTKDLMKDINDNSKRFING